MTASSYSRYQETAAGCAVDLSDNTNLWGAPPAVDRVLKRIASDGLSRYPSAYSDDLKGAIAAYVGVDESMIVVGCGSDDVLDSAIRAFGAPNDLLVQADPTFSMIPVFAAVNGLAVRAFSPLEAGFADSMIASNAAITYLCSPNNPTGTVLDIETVEGIAGNAKGLVIVDEAYIEFGGTSAVSLLKTFDNLLVTRTFSKAFGLAGFRIGYGIASPEIAERVEAARGPYKVTALSERVAIEALSNDREWVSRCVAETIENRARFVNELASLGMKPLDSGANFVLLPVNDSARIENSLRSSGVAVRRFNSLNRIGDALRISIGPWPMMQACLDALAGAVQ